MHSTSLNDFLDELQDHLDQNTEMEYGPRAFAIWKNPPHQGPLENHSSTAELTGSCGDSMRIDIVVDDDRIKDARFFTTGCGPSIISGSQACELALGKSLEEAAGIEGADILDVFDSIPEDKKHCSHLAAQTLKEAIRKYWEKKK
jgi:nitrogen fixation NifU-like protein